MEIKLAPDNPNIILSFKSRVMEVAQPIFQVCFLSFNIDIINMTHKYSRSMMLFYTTKLCNLKNQILSQCYTYYLIAFEINY